MPVIDWFRWRAFFLVADATLFCICLLFWPDPFFVRHGVPNVGRDAVAGIRLRHLGEAKAAPATPLLPTIAASSGPADVLNCQNYVSWVWK